MNPDAKALWVEYITVLANNVYGQGSEAADMLIKRSEAAGADPKNIMKDLTEQYQDMSMHKAVWDAQIKIALPQIEIGRALLGAAQNPEGRKRLEFLEELWNKLTVFKLCSPDELERLFDGEDIT